MMLKILLNLLFLFQVSRGFAGAASPHIYGKDNRNEVDLSSPRQIQRLAKGVAALVLTSDLVSSSNNQIGFKAQSFGQSQRLCFGPLENRFRNQPSLGVCTGFYIGNKQLVTAGHCLKDKNSCNSDSTLQTKKWVFGFDVSTLVEASPSGSVKVKSNRVIGCSRVLDSFHFPFDLEVGHMDYAVVELDSEPPPGTTVLEFDLQIPDRGTPVFMLGHPSGLPLKWTNEARVLKVTRSATNIESDLDAFGGNSGSPIFNQITKKVIGILVRAPESFETEPDRDCKKIIQCQGPECISRPSVSFAIAEIPLLSGKPPRIFEEKQTECLRGDFSFCKGSLVVRNGLTPLEVIPPQGRIEKAWNTGWVEVSWRSRDHLDPSDLFSDFPDPAKFWHPIRMHIENLSPDILR